MDGKEIGDLFRGKFPGKFDSIGPLEPVITLGTASKMLRTSVSMIRRYEEEGLVIYYRTETGRRMLCREDIDRIKLLKYLNKAKGINFEGIRRLLALLPCWELKPCTQEEKEKCLILKDSTMPCWTLMNTQCALKGEDCRACSVYRFGTYCTEDIKELLHGEGGADIGSVFRPKE